ncbi:uncharacterized protein LOC106129343 [Amyelois transitella]|uniref:uncharacterized protein LOC106129343 n=1 Tax=Amyelois transitella TaxID=680683 RepID=UPI00067AB045|nr:uncharacterized protein LOC106129343 [Amyelois transitella]
MNSIRIFKSVHRYQYAFLQTAKYSVNIKLPLKFSEKEARWRELDNVSQRWQLIYKAPMEKWLKYLTMYLTFSTTTIACASAYYAAFVFDVETMNDPVVIGKDVIIANNAMECCTYLGAFVLFHVAIKVLLSKYVLRLYQDGDNYLAIYSGNFYNIKKHQFHLKEFKKLNPTFVVTWGDARFGLGKRHGILLEHYFKTPQHFNYLLYKNNKNNPYSED